MLCLEMADSSLAANVFYRDGRYVSHVMAVFPYTEYEVENLVTYNPRGKLIVKQCKSFFFVLLSALLAVLMRSFVWFSKTL